MVAPRSRSGRDRTVRVTITRQGFRGAVAFVAVAVIVGWGGTPARADQFRNAQWYLAALHVGAAQRLTKGLGVTVAVVDTGVMASHRDLAGAVLPGVNILGNGGDGRTDPDGHGTQMAGIVAARGHGGQSGVLGIAPAASILPVRPVSGPLAVSRGIDWAVSRGANIISVSSAIDGSDELAESVRTAMDADVVLAAAAGNDGTVNSAKRFPAGYPGVLAVGAVDRHGAVARFSTRGHKSALWRPGSKSPSPTDISRPATALSMGRVRRRRWRRVAPL